MSIKGTILYTRKQRLSAWRDQKEREIEKKFEAERRSFSSVCDLIYGGGERQEERFDRAFAMPNDEVIIDRIFKKRESALKRLSEAYRTRKNILNTIHYIGPDSVGRIASH